MPTINTESCDVFYLQRQPEERTDTIKVCDGCIEKKNVNMNVFAFTTEDMINKQKHIMSIIGINKNQTHYPFCNRPEFEKTCSRFFVPSDSVQRKLIQLILIKTLQKSGDEQQYFEY